MPKKIDLTGKKFGRLTVIEESGRNNHGNVLWKCICECGNYNYVTTHLLMCGDTKSCGCLKSEFFNQLNSGRSTTLGHGLSNTPIYHCWCAMKGRCSNKNNPSYKNYGARGITVCEEWKNSFKAFYEWAIAHGYRDDLTIDRIDVNGNYEPSNCRWITLEEQAGNKRTNVKITYCGETKTVSEWARILGVERDRIGRRKRDGWSDEECIEGKRKHK